MKYSSFLFIATLLIFPFIKKRPLSHVSSSRLLPTAGHSAAYWILFTPSHDGWASGSYPPRNIPLNLLQDIAHTSYNSHCALQALQPILCTPYTSPSRDFFPCCSSKNAMNSLQQERLHIQRRRFICLGGRIIVS